MIDLSAPTLLQLLSARDASDGVSSDTRAALQGKMFAALKGANFDGNAFVKQALDQGATHVISTDEQWADSAKVTVVEDTLAALQTLARAYRRRWTCPVLAMTGSNGKTTTKELIRDVLATRFQVHATLGNLNNHIGVPLTLLNAPAQPEFVVVEMGANHQREIDFLARIAEPTHGYITNIGLAHLEGFGGPEGVYRGKKELFDYLAAHEGTAFVQLGDDKVVHASQEVHTCVQIPTPEWTWSSRPSGGGIASLGSTSIPMNLEGSYNLPNVVAAFAIGAHFGVSEKEACRALSNYVPSNHRSQSVKTARNGIVLDAYNANPSSMTHALNDFALRGHDKPLVILGDMAELGDASEGAHREVVDMCRAQGLELWSVGQWFGRIHDEGGHNGWKHFSDLDTLIAHLQSSPCDGRQILVKGSRSAALERLLPYL